MTMRFKILLLLLFLKSFVNAIPTKTKYGVWNMSESPKGLIPDSPSFMVDEKNQQFLLDGQPFRYISGSIHYFRIPLSYWEDRLQKVRALGFNAIQYYIPWNMHELNEGQYDFSGLLDFAHFSQLAHKYGLWTILRLGPYICGEQENGGLPAWILNKNVTKQRSGDKVYIAEVEKWFAELLPRVKPLLRKNGGPVLMLQIENEYGSYDACDHNYMRFLRDLTHQYVGNDVLLFTTDGPGEKMLNCGTIEGVLPTVDFGPTRNKEEIENHFKMQRKIDPTAPLVNSEYYPGWLVLWGQKKQELPNAEDIVFGAQTIYDLGGNINFYMIHGGTNFGLWNGAETDAAVITSYDYSAPISEAGDVTKNYLEIRKWVKSLKNWPVDTRDVPVNKPKKAYGQIKMRLAHSASSLSQINEPGDCQQLDQPASFEQLGHPFGLVAYQTTIGKCGNLSIPAFGDFVYVYLNKKYMGTLTRKFYNITTNSITIDGCSENNDNRLFLLVENQGRLTYETINDHKGILSGVYLNGELLHGWLQCGIKLPMMYDQSYGKLSTKKISRKWSEVKAVENQKQGVFVGVLTVEIPTDTWLDTTGWGKGIVIVNGHNIGRYWATQGPQLTLYIPAEFLKTGSNLIMVVELEGAQQACPDQKSCVATFIDHPIFQFE